jgi:hypothetical protein
MLAVMVFAVAAHAEAEPKTTGGAERIYVHTATHGDTFLKLANRYLSDRANWAVLSKYNPKVDPVKIPLGFPIQIPVTAMRAELAGATVVAVRGTADANSQKLSVGQTLSEKDKVRTGDDGFVTIKLADGSTLTIQSKSAVALERTRQLANTNVSESVIQLERGRLETSVSKQHAAGRYEVKTPTSNMGVRGTVFRAGADETGKKAFSEVIEGAVGVAGAGGGAGKPDAAADGAAAVVSLSAGFGSVVEAGKPPSLPVKLLAAPPLPTMAAAQTKPGLKFAIAPVAGAAAYRAQVALDKAFLQLVSEQVVSKPAIEFNDLPDGVLYLRLRAVDQAGLEGLDATTPFTVAARPLAPKLVSPASDATVGAGQTIFSWSAAPGVAAYRIQVAANDAFSPVSADKTVASGTSLALPIGNTGARVWWRVASVDANGKQGPFGDAQAFGIRTSRLKVTPVVVGNISQLKWKGGNDELYHIEVSRRESFQEILQSRVTPESTLLLEKLPKGTYFVRVRTVGPQSSLGNIKDAGEWSDVQAIEVFSTLF